MASEMTEKRLKQIEAEIGCIDCPDCFGTGEYDESEPCDECEGNGTISRWPGVNALIAALRQAWQERDIEAKAALACNDALVRERAALATAQAEIARLQQCPPEATGYWPDHIRAIAEQRDAAQAECDALRAERDALAEQVSTGEAVLLAYDMTPQGLRGMADKLASEINNDPDCWEMDVVGALRTVAVAFTAYEDWISSAKLQRDQTQAALTEARRVLRLVDKQARRECPVCFSPGWTHKEGCALAAVLAQEGGHDAA